jgi:dipeptide/tripeptide permease
VLTEAAQVGISRWFWQGFFLASLGILLVAVGLLLLTDWPQRLGPWTDFVPHLWLPLGLCLVAAGEFLLAVVAEDLCPQADPRVIGAMQLAPWVVVFGVVLWWIL